MQKAGVVVVERTNTFSGEKRPETISVAGSFQRKMLVPKYYVITLKATIVIPFCGIFIAMPYYTKSWLPDQSLCASMYLSVILDSWIPSISYPWPLKSFRSLLDLTNYERGISLISLTQKKIKM